MSETAAEIPRSRGHSCEAATARTAPPALVAVAEAFLHTLSCLFGTPGDVAGGGWLTAKAHKLLASWLRCAEAMVRRLIAIEAAALPRANTRPPRKKRRRERKLHYFYAEEPEAWRVSFSMFVDRRRPRRHNRKRCAQSAGEAPAVQVRFRNNWPLALRYEAMLRALHAHAAHAARFARRLYANPERLSDPLRAPPEAEYRIDHFEAFGDQARTAWRAHFSSA